MKFDTSIDSRPQIRGLFYFLNLEMNIENKLGKYVDETAAATILTYLSGKNFLNHDFVIEACHFYQNHPLTLQEIAGIETCGKLADDLAFALSQTGQVENVVFVDDYNAIPGKSLVANLRENSRQAWQVIEDSGFGENVRFVFLESLMLQAGSGILAGLLLTGQCRQTKSKILLNVPARNEGVVLLRKDSGEGIPSCALLDAGCYGLKGRYFPDAIHVTVLPENYQKQQEETHEVMKAWGIDIPIINVFVGNNGNQQVKFNF